MPPATKPAPRSPAPSVRLTARQRAVLKLQFGEGVGRAQIAERLGSSERIVKRDLMKSYEKLRLELNSDLLRVLSNGRE